ncbi:RT0821/Lpp0805 family surface protein [Arhodomonas sp. SL1]|uniref:RT0821/Lpp0805 family surface protein n=1 Tax=Arhodomonas sp. SL1 TaxID=3425691 RepID=UPI003F885D80
MRTRTTLAITLAAAIGLGGCATDQGPSEQVGMVIGGVLGGVLGHQVGGGTGQTAATIAGTMIGSAIGGNIGRTMDEVDRRKVGTTLETTRTGVTSTWQNPDTGAEYAVTPTRTYETSSGPCREFTMEAEIGGGTEEVYGTACRQPDGSWRIQE